MPSDDEDVPLDVLRRRVYGPSATEADRVRYRAALGGAVPPPAGAEPARPGRRRPRPTAVLACVLVLGVAAAVALLPRPAGPPTRLPADAVAVGAAMRDRAVRSLAAGRAPALPTALVGGALPGERTDGRVLAPERTGRGPASVALRPPDRRRATRVTVVLVTGSDATGGWSAYDLADDAIDATHLFRAADRTGVQPAGVPTAVTYVSASDASPARLDIDLPKGVRWAVQVVYA